MAPWSAQSVKQNTILDRSQPQHGAEGEKNEEEAASEYTNQSDRGNGALQQRLYLLKQEKEDPQDDGDKVAGIAKDVFPKFLHFPKTFYYCIFTGSTCERVRQALMLLYIPSRSYPLANVLHSRTHKQFLLRCLVIAVVSSNPKAGFQGSLESLACDFLFNLITNY